MFATTKKYEYASGGVNAKFTGTCYRYDSDGNVASSKPYEKVSRFIRWYMGQRFYGPPGYELGS